MATKTMATGATHPPEEASRTTSRAFMATSWTSTTDRANSPR